jgi:hypothetical protein
VGPRFGLACASDVPAAHFGDIWQIRSWLLPILFIRIPPQVRKSSNVPGTVLEEQLMKSSLRVVVTAVVASAVAFGLLVPAQPAGATSRTCAGFPVTITSSAPTVQGTSRRDVILAVGISGQTINAGAGDDVICGSSGADRIIAGDGNDTVFAGLGNDTIDGGTGGDVVNGGLGDDVINGGANDDRLSGDAGNDRVSGDAGADQVSGNVGNDRLFGGDGSDAVSGDVGNDQVVGDAGDDRLSGAEGSDTLTGGPGNDVLNGGQAPDVVDPGPGANTCGADPTDSVRGSCSIDRAGVTISDVTVPGVVSSGGVLTISWRAVDGAGVSNTNMRIGGASGWVTSWCGFVVSANLVSGTAFDGRYEATCTVPANAVNGSYTVFLSASDVFGNSSAWDSSTQFDFTINGGASDASPPTVTGLQAWADGSDVVVRWRAADPAGVAGQSAWLALNGYSFASVEGPYFLYNAAVLVEGDSFNGVYEQRMNRRSLTPSGTFTVWLTTIDGLGNKSFAMTPTSVSL